ncbi:coiled-coil protein [Wolffia australiana]
MESRWSDEVEDLVERGEIDGAIAVLESIVARIETSDSTTDDPLPSCDDSNRRAAAAAMADLANLLDKRGSSIRADDLRNQAAILRENFDKPQFDARDALRGSAAVEEKSSALEDVDDWETLADGPLPSVVESETVRQESVTKRRGRGHFLYEGSGLYSDQVHGSEFDGASSSEIESNSRGGRRETREMSNSPGFRHALVLEDFSQSTRTTDLEKIFERFKEDGMAVRWVHDTCALVLFRSPSVASQALHTTSCPFKIRMIEDENDSILSLTSSKDLEPPQPRPKTSARAAQRMIAQGMGLKLQNSFGSKELRIQEAERRNRIQARRGLRDDAWGPDV